MHAKIAVILVTYNSQRFLPKAMDCLFKQTLPPSQIVIVDTGSTDRSYLKEYKKKCKILFEKQDAGFCRGNNTGYRHIHPDIDFVLLLNPDAFLTPDLLEKAARYLIQHPTCGALTGQLLGFDIDTMKPTGKYDSTGIFSTWYGRWFDRHQGSKIGLALKKQEIPAICGALFLARKKALDDCLIRSCEILDNTFYMYKEDIDLSLRLKSKGWTLHFLPELIAYHCRGWSPDRKKMARKMRLCSAKNEFRIQTARKHPTGMLYSLLKLFAVLVFDK